MSSDNSYIYIRGNSAAAEKESVTMARAGAQNAHQTYAMRQSQNQNQNQQMQEQMQGQRRQKRTPPPPPPPPSSPISSPPRSNWNLNQSQTQTQTQAQGNQTATKEQERVIATTLTSNQNQGGHFNHNENSGIVRKVRAKISAGNLIKMATEMQKGKKEEEEMSESAKLQSRQVDAEIIADYMRATPPAPRVFTNTVQTLKDIADIVPRRPRSPLHLRHRNHKEVPSPLGSPRLNTPRTEEGGDSEEDRDYVTVNSENSRGGAGDKVGFDCGGDDDYKKDEKADRHREDEYALQGDEEASKKQPPQLRFPPLRPRGVPTVTPFPSVPRDVSPTRTVNGVVLSRDMINRMVYLYTHEHKEKYWTIARHIADEYGLVISSLTAYQALAEEGVLPTETVNLEDGGTEERVTRFEEDEIFAPHIVCGQVISRDVMVRIVRLWDMGKTQVSTIAQYIRQEYGVGIMVETVAAVLDAAGREARWDF